ncbi:hypothetical protein A9Q95_12255 [Rhodobacterales bacterium 59_46_T64]|nr:hypothetical protein A9Q95_12255 [Rhodobacterales bacterium 59_46_T64]
MRPLRLWTPHGRLSVGGYGVLPASPDHGTTGPRVREVQRHLAQWGLAPVAALMAQEASDKLGSGVMLDGVRPCKRLTLVAVEEKSVRSWR